MHNTYRRTTPPWPAWKNETKYDGEKQEALGIFTYDECKDAFLARKAVISQLIDLTDAVVNPHTGQIDPSYDDIIQRREQVARVSVGLGLLTKSETGVLMDSRTPEIDIYRIFYPEKLNQSMITHRNWYGSTKSGGVGLILFYKHPYISLLESFCCLKASQECEALLCGVVNDETIVKVAGLTRLPATKIEQRIDSLTAVSASGGAIHTFHGSPYNMTLQNEIVDLGIDKLFLPTSNIHQVRDLFSGFDVFVRPSLPFGQNGMLDPTNIAQSFENGLLNDWRYRRLGRLVNSNGKISA